MLSPEDKLSKAIAYQFKNIALLEQALTHRSVSKQNNERLEFLGDAVLGCVIADELFHRFPKASEGQLTRLRATLVKGETLAEIGAELSLGDCIRLGSGELKSGGHRRASILACGVEAIIGAVYMDSGFDAVKQLVVTLYEKRLEQLSPEKAHKDPKTRLQEFMQSRQMSLPVYELLKVEGEAHAQIFYVLCQVDGMSGPISGTGKSRRKAEQDAARKAYDMVATQ